METLTDASYILNDDVLRDEILLMNEIRAKADMHYLLNRQQTVEYICARIPEARGEARD